MAGVILALCSASAVAATAFGLYLVLTHQPYLLPKLLACMLLIDHSVVTILFLRLPVVVPPLRLAVRIGSVGISIAGILLFVWNAIPREGDFDSIVTVLSAVLVAQGLLSWRYLTTKKDVVTSGVGASR